MNSFTQSLKQKVRRKEKIVCAFLTLGFPSLSHTKQLIRAFDKIGVDIVELGFPFSDPLADGPTIQKASDDALRRHIQLHDAFDIVKALRREGCNIPIVFFSYFNPILHRGVETFAKLLHESGFEGVVIPDLPPEEAKTSDKFFRKYRLAQIHLVAPTTEPNRMRSIVQKSEGFVYYVSLKGVTGVRKALPNDVASQVRKIKRLTDKAVLVGFGVSSAKQAKQICRFADGVIVGSAIINSLATSGPGIGKTVQFVKSLVDAAKSS
ncbi:MAG: tryptophan synthase subunit alpha [Candidatus Omnitrophica bacterium]|nr:tryptophan synthase subunit alpha [Candidatus Omnitrophota bacterium]